MSYFVTTLTTGSTIQSTPVYLNSRGYAPVTASVTAATSTMTCDYTLQYTLDDPQAAASISWQNWAPFNSTAAAQVGVHFTSSQSFPDGTTFTFTAPIAGLRMSSTALSSSTLTLKVLQVDHS